MDEFTMRVAAPDVVEIEFRRGDDRCRYRVRWKAFCDAVLLTDFAVRHGEEALARLVNELARCGGAG